MTTDPDIRKSHSADVSGLVMLPDSVARPESADEVREILRQASADRTPVTPAGSQTSTTGASIADKGILLSMRAMNRVIDIDAGARRVVVEPGVLLGDLNRVLAQHGLMFSPDPTSLDDVTVGGAIACNASGARSLLYGPTRAHVAALQVVLASGDVADVRRTGLEKNTVGYAFAQEPVDWFVGSEGTLGVITRAELLLLPLPERVIGLALPFPDEGSALRCVLAIRDPWHESAAPMVTARCIEYFDAVSIEIARTHAGAPWKGGGLLYVEDVSSAPDTLDRWLALAEVQGAVVGDIGVFEGESALRDARRFRHAVPATMNERGTARRAYGGRKVSTDWAVPYRKLHAAIVAARGLVDDAGLPQPAIYGHAGSGHPHENFVARDADEVARVEQVVEQTLRHVLALGGTVSAEHGIGKIKRRWLPLQATPLQISVMRAVKRELDPLGILAPGNIL